MIKKVENSSAYSLPNPWRKKAAGRILRNVPITLYCDDTSGNKSKKWNKHISYYFTLSGLPPNISNQQFNCHFLCTSNTVGALELGEMVVAQLKYVHLFSFEIFAVLFGRSFSCVNLFVSFLQLVTWPPMAL
jgi:hypothetical protein